MKCFGEKEDRGLLKKTIVRVGFSLGLATILSAGPRSGAEPATRTTTPIQHVVVIFDENISFDHYFATYPNAANLPGESVFKAAPNTPSVNGLTPELLNNNPNSTQPFRLDPLSMASTCDNSNHYTPEQKAYNGGLVDKFPANTAATGAGCTSALSMGYYDGNTVTALWNYAQHYALSDNFFASEFGTTVMGHLNLISGQTHTDSNVSSIKNTTVANGSIIANVEAGVDDCVNSTNGTPVVMTGKNVGDLLNAKGGISWGWFYAEFPQSPNNQPLPFASCPASYNSHYDPFQYYTSTSNPHHLPPSSTAAIGTASDQANHQYSLTDFWNAANHGNLPAVSFLKPPKSETGHPSDSTPLQEQTFLVNTINALMKLDEWKSMAILITYDDSDGWYDHVMPPIMNQSDDPVNDALLGMVGRCGTPKPGAYNDRCGYGPRLPLLVISPFAKQNYVNHTQTDTSSVLRFIEDNWNLGRIGNQSFDALAGSILDSFDFKSEPHAKALFLDPTTGQVMKEDD
jgi:phospholipase C